MTTKNQVDERILQIIGSGVLELETPIDYEGKKLTHCRKTGNVKVIHRIKATNFAKAEFDTDSGDAIIAGTMAQVIEFDTSAEFTNPVKVDANTLVDALDYSDYTYLSMLMGKKAGSPESNTNTSGEPSDSSQQETSAQDVKS